jgi:hypothetical protein
MDAKPVDDPPYSTEKYDEGALLPEQQRKINELKVIFQVIFFFFYLFNRYFLDSKTY